MQEFLAMGGYAAFVWPAYGAAALILAGLLWHSRAALRRNEALLRQLEAARPARRRRRNAPIGEGPVEQGPAHPGATPQAAREAGR